jgi:hypothetical protein
LIARLEVIGAGVARRARFRSELVGGRPSAVVPERQETRILPGHVAVEIAREGAAIDVFDEVVSLRGGHQTQAVLPDRRQVVGQEGVGEAQAALGPNPARLDRGPIVGDREMAGSRHSGVRADVEAGPSRGEIAAQRRVEEHREPVLEVAPAA